MSTDRDEWVTLTDAQVDALDVGTVVRLTQEDVTITGPLHVVTDYEIIVGRPRGATTWGAYRDGGVQVRPEDVPVDPKVIEALAAAICRECRVAHVHVSTHPDNQPVPHAAEARDALAALRMQGFDVVRAEP